MQKNFLGIDYGEKRIGLAVGNNSEKIAHTFKIIHKMNELDDIIPAKNIHAFVIGLPLQPNGIEGKTADMARLFAARLQEKFNLPIYWMDEKKSSTSAEDYLKNTLFMRQNKRKNILDAESARIILQRWFDSNCT
ncbi:MAG: Holliday junction resolvase RuvX [Alphaproteobacteria bacterium]|nr:Holliday junction resolvase RuvX [Alphaproteobacteria bacterium]